MFGVHVYLIVNNIAMLKLSCINCTLSSYAVHVYMFC